MNKGRKIELALILAVVALFSIVGGVLAAKIWEHRYDSVTVRADLGINADKLYVYGYDAKPVAGGTVVATYDVTCVGAYGPRIDVFIPPVSDTLKARFICAVMTPTPAPPQP